MSRWLALPLAIIGGAILGYAMLLVIGGGLLGFLWLFVFGDDPWPAWSDYLLGAGVVGGGLAAWGYCSWMLWKQLRPKS